MAGLASPTNAELSGATRKQSFQPSFSLRRWRHRFGRLHTDTSRWCGSVITIESLVFAVPEVAKISAAARSPHRGLTCRRLGISFITKPMFWLIDTLYRFFGNSAWLSWPPPSSSKPSSSRSPTSPMRRGAPKKVRPNARIREMRGRQDGAAEGDDGALHKRRVVLPLPSGGVADPQSSSRSTRCSTAPPSRCGCAVLWRIRIWPRDHVIFSLFSLIPVTLRTMLMIGVWPASGVTSRSCRCG